MRRIALAFLASLVMAAQPVHAAEYTAEKPLRLSMTSTFMDNHPVIAKGLLGWAEEIKQGTGGRVVIEFYNPNTLCPEGDIYESVKTGLVSIGSHNVTRNRGKFPLARVMDLPFLYSSAESGAVSNWRLYENFPELQKEFGETHILTFWSSAVDQLHSAKKPMASLAELKGAQIGAMSGSYIDLLGALGASAVQLSPNDLYLALQRGQVDGVVCPFAYMRSTKVYEAAKHSYVANMKSNGFYLAMNKDIWNSLPADIQQVFTGLSGEGLARRLGQITDQGVLDDLEFMKAEGQQITPLTPEERALWAERVQVVVQDWLKECQSKGPASAILEAARANEAEFGPTAAYAYK